MTLFAQTLAPKEQISLDTLQDPQLLALTSRFVKKTKDGWMSVTYLYPTGGKWPREVPHVAAGAQRQASGGILTGINLVSGTLRRIVQADAVRSTIIGLIAVVAHHAHLASGASARPSSRSCRSSPARWRCSG